MKKFSTGIVNFLKEEDGPTAVEYAILLALIIVVCIGSITTIGSRAKEQFDLAGKALKVPT
jgi:pilus assembly protein Flp/PilA